MTVNSAVEAMFAQRELYRKLEESRKSPQTPDSVSMETRGQATAVADVAEVRSAINVGIASGYEDDNE